ncbi:hypothetical protein NTE_01600 [Candidatus Nitrososphaera evergladensis SR1]|jgi:hypothetical protein|uniref:Uncharacterized protein n=1 Tax=Candidatus Nitrososphaera evergladensis SR1 TaxID=1459636 RepID=A0A075MR32_9ARCH|nr:hypothetical protein [Candidatus Nitrososphaera evergladensis]AIF83663.1 hypothetical protein NTE_01600 [Candidatus Nitrososphaera evergladensis SR1]
MTVDLSQYLTNTLNPKVFLAPNTSDQEVVEKAKKLLVQNGLREDLIQVNYDMQQLDVGDLNVSYDPPDLVVRAVYDKKPSGIVKMKSVAMIKL